MTGSLRHASTSRTLVLRFVLALLALLGSQGAFVRAAFPRATSVPPATAWERGTPHQAPSYLDAAPLHTRSTRRGAATVGPSEVGRAEMPATQVVIRPAGQVAAFEAPPSFVPPPPFHPPRAR